jgi:hypothetical protein
MDSVYSKTYGLARLVCAIKATLEEDVRENKILLSQSQESHLFQ